MKTVIIILAVLILTAGPLYAVQQPLPPDQEQIAPPPTPAQEQPEVLTSGPVHEAFAEPVNLQVQEGLVAPVQPPPNIAEAPPTESPQDGHYVWVPGYWSWDADRNNYIWVSACWRAAPPGMYWVPGYWAQVADGWEWVAGFWSPMTNQEIEYLPPPPAVEDVQPPTPPSPDNIWVPPCWYWHQNQYIRRPGYWLTAQTDWIWVPSHYIWTPRGYVFVAGHWDYTLERRGILFAPVYFPHSVYTRVGFSYSPSIVIDIGALSFSLFTYPRYSHYYFGDYYDNAYLRIGIYPWFETERFRTWYDPIYQHDRWHYRRSEPRWEQRQRHEYDLRRSDRNLRPARTYREMQTRLTKLPEPQRRDFQMAQPLTAFAAGKTRHPKFEHINAKSQRDITTHATAVRQFGEERHRWESPRETPKISQPTVQPKAPVTTPTEHKAPITITPERKAPVVTPPAERKESITTTPEHKAPVVAPPTERKEPITITPEHKAPVVTPPVERKEPIITTPERKAPVVTPPTERKAPVATPQERKAPVVTPPVERKEKERVTAPEENRAPFVPPRQVHINKPEKVKVPNPPVVGKQTKAEKGPPPNPDGERRERGGEKNPPEKGQPKGEEKQKKK